MIHIDLFFCTLKAVFLLVRETVAVQDIENSIYNSYIN